MNDEQKAEAQAAEDLKRGFLSLWVITGQIADERGYRHGSAARREFLDEIDRAAMAGAFRVFSRKLRSPITQPQSINIEVHAFESEVRAWMGRDKTREPAPAPEGKIKRNKLIERHAAGWPNIESDLKHQKELTALAKLGYGYWDENKVLAWGRANGRLPASKPDAIPDLARRGSKHKLK